MTTEAMSDQRRKAAVPFIFATALMDVLALGVMIPVLPNLVKSMAGGDTARAADYTMVFAVTWGAMQFVVSPLQGMLSDRFGRRPVLLISVFGLGIDYIFMALAPTLAWLYVGRVINGVTSASFSTANAYIADVTAPEDRAKAFGLMGAAWGVGFVIGPVIGGLLGQMNLRWPFYLSAALALTNWLYGYFILPESLPKSRRAKTLNWAKANPLGSLALLRSKPGLLALAAVYFLFQMAHNVFPSIFVLFVGREVRLGAARRQLHATRDGVRQHLRAGHSGWSGGEAPGRARGVVDRSRLIGGGDDDLRLRADRSHLLSRRGRGRPQRPDEPRAAGPHDPSGRAVRAGAVAGR